MTRPLAQRDHPLSWRGGRSSAVPRGRRRRYDAFVVVCPRILPTHFGGPDRRLALSSILKSMLVTYSSFLGALLAPPPSAASNAPPEWHRQVEWITVLAQNVMAAANDLRPVQVRPFVLCPCVHVDDGFFLRGFVCSGTREPRAHDETSTGGSEGRDKSYS
jgi:MED7 protein